MTPPDPQRFPMTTLMLRGLELTDDQRGIENGLVSWVDQCSTELSNGGLSGYYRRELNIGGSA